MSSIRFSLAQLDAFASVCEHGTVTAAARRLKKDRTTVSELIENLETEFGYVLFNRDTRPLTLTKSGELLYRQARLLLHKAQALSQVAEQIPTQLLTQLTICYDPLTPRSLVLALADELASLGVHFDLICCDREVAEQRLDAGTAHLGIFQAINQAVNSRHCWLAIGSMEMAIYAKKDFFSSSPVSLLSLASSTQIIPYLDSSSPLVTRLKIADRVKRVNETRLLLELLSVGHGWAFLPTHIVMDSGLNIEKVLTEFGDASLTQSLIALWAPVKTQPSCLDAVLEFLREWHHKV